MSEEKKQPEEWEKALGCLLILVMIPLSTLVARDGWTWFAVPLGAPLLSWAHMFGLMLLVAVLRGKRSDATPPWTKHRDSLAVLLVVWGLMYATYYWGMPK